MSTTATSAPASSTVDAAFWERLWRSAGVQAAAFFVVGLIAYGAQPGTSASADALGAFYVGERVRILVAAVILGMATLNLLWFAAAFRATLASEGKDGWGAAATAASAAFGALFLLFLSLAAALSFAIAGSGNTALTAALNQFSWALIVLTSFPRAMLIMSGSFGLWRAGLISNGVFAVCVGAVVLVLLGGTTWLSDGFWAPDGLYSRLVSPVIGLIWLVPVSLFLLRRPASQTGW